MKATILLLVLLLVSTRLVHAQNAVAAAPSDSLIKVNVVPSGRYSHVLYTMNDEPLTDATMKQLLWKNPESAVEMRKFRANRRWVFALVPVSLAGLIVGCVQGSQNKDATGSAFSRAPVPFSIYLAGLAGMLVVGATNDHYGKAIEAYNRHFRQQASSK
jgi:hypothetical protein